MKTIIAKVMRKHCVQLTLLLAITATGWSQEYTISTIAGGSPPPTPQPGVSASIGAPQGVATDAVGNVYFTSLHCLFKLDLKGVLTVVAGNSRPGYSGDGGLAISAQLNLPASVALDSSGNVYVADVGNGRIRRVSPSGSITTVAGGGWQSGSGDGLPATSVQLRPNGVALDSNGNLYIADDWPSRVRRVAPNGIITTVAGTGVSGYSGDGGPATSAQLASPQGVAVDSTGNLYIVDSANARIRRVSPSGIITTLAGNGTSGFSGDNGPATSASLSEPAGVAVDSTGNVYIADTRRIRRVTPNGIITTVAGNGLGGYSGDGGPATSAGLSRLSGICVDPSGNLYIADQASKRIRRISVSGVITTVAGNGAAAYLGDGGPATAAQLDGPTGVALDSAGNVYVAQYGDSRIRRVSTRGIITTVAGNGTCGYSGDAGAATSAQLCAPEAVAVDSNGNLYIADVVQPRIRRVSASGIMTTVAGNGKIGYSGDGGPATSAQLGFPTGVAVDSLGNLYIVDSLSQRVRRVAPNGIITTVAGSGTTGAGGYSGDGGPASSARLNNPTGIALDSKGNIYIADMMNYRVRRVAPDGIITTVAGIGDPGPTGDGGQATSAGVGVLDVAVDSSGNLYIVGYKEIRKVSPSGIISTIAGNGSNGYSGDGGPATSAQITTSNVAVDSSGRVYLTQPGAVRLLTPADTSCAYTAAPAALPSAASGESLSVSIETTAGCAWTISGLPTWIAASPAWGRGPATATLITTTNTGVARSVVVSVAGSVVTVSQAADPNACIYTTNPEGQAFGMAGGSGAISISTSPGCAWSVTSALNWVTFTSDASGSGNGQVTYQVAANPDPSRHAIFAVAGQNFSIEQLGPATSAFRTAGAMAHIASGGGWKTTFTLVNNGIAAAQARLSFFADSGTEINLPLTFPQSGTETILASAIERTLAAGASLIIECEGPLTESMQQGWALLKTTDDVNGFAIFQVLATGQQAVVPLETRNAPSYLLAFDYTNGLKTGLALANLSAIAGNVRIVVRDDTGAAIPTKVTSIPLDGTGHTSFMLDDAAHGFPELEGKRGTVEFDTPSGGQISVLGIRAHGKAITTLPVLAQVGTTGGALAHVATGAGWETLFTLVNTGASSAPFTLSFYDEQTGAPLPLPLVFPQGGSPQTTDSVTQTFAPGATLLIQTQGGSATVACSAQLTTTGTVSGFAIFQIQGSGQEAVVPLETRTPAAFVLAYDNTDGLATGVALANLITTAANVNVVVRDDNGARIQTDQVQLGGNGHASFMLTDPAQGFPATTGKRGTVEFDTPSGGRISALGIRAVTNVITTIPVFAK